MSEINVNTIDKATGSTLNVGAAGTTVNIAGTAGTGFPASGAALTGSTNNTVVTVTGANAIQGEADLTFDGTNLDLPDNKKIRLGTGNDLEVYHDANNSYLKNNINSLISLSAGHYWRNVADTSNSGMCIVSSNVGIGEETPLGKLHVKTGDSGGTAHVGSDELVVEGSGDSGMTILSATNGDATIRFGDSGNNQIGRVAYNHSSNYLNFWTNNSEAMRIDQYNNVGIGTTSVNAKFEVVTNINGVVARFVNDGDDANRDGIYVQGGHDNGSGTTTYFLAADGDGTSTGGLETSSGTFQLFNTSDKRLKQNIVDTSINGINSIKNLKVRDFAYKKNPTETIVGGFIAQELKEVFPQAVSEGRTEEKILSVSRERLVPFLTKALQEAITKIETLETANTNKNTKITALETSVADLTTRLEALENA
jgi:6-pyruvoyl-tetrahydropterin synthase